MSAVQIRYRPPLLAQKYEETPCFSGPFLFRHYKPCSRQVWHGWRTTIPSNCDGRFFTRLVVPKDLRTIVGKSELRAALGPDRRTAMKMLPGAVAPLQHQIAQAERQAAPANSAASPAHYPPAPAQIALSH
ncbi:DUF6538 domain-containing protein [Pseudogemmobacter hezensis]|uniref:DUF6538 domain-containing protein n=1 Tax=Pseudogemmobacter hezensis TaxID=2737662 RepID=UPI003458953C